VRPLSPHWLGLFVASSLAVSACEDDVPRPPRDATVAADSVDDATDDVATADSKVPADAVAMVEVTEPANPIVVENRRAGSEGWRLLRPAENHEVEGYASTTSAAPGEPFEVRVNVDAAHTVAWEAWRVGHYGGTGGRLVARGGARPVAPQPTCPVDARTGMVECAWESAFTVTPDGSWVTGAYLLKLVRDDGWESYVPMVIREATPRAPLVFQASVNTWQAYNDWGGASLYVNDTKGAFTGEHAYRVSFDRPYTGSDCCGTHGAGQLLFWEAYMARWLESRGYDVAYVTNVDVDRSPDAALGGRMFITVGHDEYWTMGERDALERARDRGLSLGFFSADTGVYHVRYAPSTAGGERRSMICYKFDAARFDPERGTSLQTTRFALPPLSRPENELLGVISSQWSGGARLPLVVTDPEHWIYEGTGVARGDTLGFVVGSEWDRVIDNGRTPAGIAIVAESPGLDVEGFVGVAHATVYQPTAQSVVFAAGTLSWAQGLARPGVIDARIQRMTENVLARAGLAVTRPTEVPPPAPVDRPGTASAVERVAGSGVAGYLDGPAATARFDAPAGVAASPAGVLYVTDQRNHRVRAIDAMGRVSTLAGCGPDGAARSERFRDGAGDAACFDRPSGIAVAADGTVYVSDTGNLRIRAITPAGVVSTWAGSGDWGRSDGTRLRATFASPRGLAVAPDGSLYVADTGAGAVRRITAAGVTTVVRDLNDPLAVAVAADGRVYVLCNDGTLRVAVEGRAVVAGSPFDFDFIEGRGERARFRPGDGLAAIGDRLIVGDANNHRVRSVALVGDREVTTLVGDGRVGVGIGAGATTQLALPRGVARYRDGVAIVDAANHRVLYARP
jgi:hypothetical protein